MSQDDFSEILYTIYFLGLFYHSIINIVGFIKGIPDLTENTNHIFRTFLLIFRSFFWFVPSYYKRYVISVVKSEITNLKPS